jgi:hypothetical protein
MFRRATVDDPIRPDEVTLTQALRPVLIHLGLKLFFMWLMRVAIRHALDQMEAEKKQ